MFGIGTQNLSNVRVLVSRWHRTKYEHYPFFFIEAVPTKYRPPADSVVGVPVSREHEDGCYENRNSPSTPIQVLLPPDGALRRDWGPCRTVERTMVRHYRTIHPVCSRTNPKGHTRRIPKKYERRQWWILLFWKSSPTGGLFRISFKLMFPHVIPNWPSPVACSRDVRAKCISRETTGTIAPPFGSWSDLTSNKLLSHLLHFPRNWTRRWNDRWCVPRRHRHILRL